MSSFPGLVHDYLVYFEIHLHPNKKEGVFSVCSLSVGPTLVRSFPSQNALQISAETGLLRFHTSDEVHHLEGTLEFNRNERDCILSLQKSTYLLTLIHPGTKTPTICQSATERFRSVRSEVTCPKCLGKGHFYSMSIPKSAYESGLSGYALYTENTICCYTGCPLCGGHGMSYENWYIREENIDTKKIAPLVCGTGRVVICDNTTS